MERSRVSFTANNPSFAGYPARLRRPAITLSSWSATTCRPTSRSPRGPRIAIIAHDGKKADLVAFATFNRRRLQEYDIVATGATGDLLRDKVGLDVERVTAGPHGGDVQIASRVVEGDIDAVLFMVDPLDKHPHDPDIQTLLRICNVCNIPLATNIATADVLMSSPLLQEFRAAAS